MGATRTITATEFKATCLDILDRLAAHELESVTITKRGRAVGVLTPPAKPPASLAELSAAMRGSVTIPPGYDVTRPATEEPWDAEHGHLHR